MGVGGSHQQSYMVDNSLHCNTGLPGKKEVPAGVLMACLLYRANQTALLLDLRPASQGELFSSSGL